MVGQQTTHVYLCLSDGNTALTRPFICDQGLASFPQNSKNNKSTR